MTEIKRGVTEMSDLIRREDAIKALYEYSFVSKNVIEREIKAIPTADRPQGEWIDKGNWMGIECSRCKCHSRYVTPFCPQCGARMKGADNERSS